MYGKGLPHAGYTHTRRLLVFKTYPTPINVSYGLIRNTVEESHKKKKDDGSSSSGGLDTESSRP
jgi:hypothetical protein